MGQVECQGRFDGIGFVETMLAAKLLKEMRAIGYSEDKISIYFDNPNAMTYLNTPEIRQLIEYILAMHHGQFLNFVPLSADKLAV